MKATYARHFDCCMDSILEMGLLEYLRSSDYRERVVTMILYLNDPDWKPRDDDSKGDGGELRCFHPKQAMVGEGSMQQSAEVFTDITPRGGTLIIFDSRKIE